MKAKLSFRLGLVFGLIIFFSLAFSYVYQGRQLRKVLFQNVRTSLLHDLRLTAGMLENRPPGWSNPELSDQWTDRVGKTLDVRVTLIGLDGKVIGDSYVSAAKLAMLENHRNREEVKAALAGGLGEATRFSVSVRENMLYMAMPVGRPEHWAVLRLAKPLHDIAAVEAQIDKGIEGGLYWALLLALTAGTLSAVFLSRPLVRIASAADRFLHGETEVKIPVKHDDEIGRLARAFNYLSEEIVRLTRKEEWLREVLSSIREAIIVTNASGEIVLANPAASRLFMIEAAWKRSIPVTNIEDPGMRELFERVHRRQSGVYNEELSAMTSKGRRTLKVTAVPVMKGEQFDGTVLVINDVTRLRNLERTRRDFVSSVSHELRTPLASIKGYTETLLEGAMNDPENATAFLNIILQESEQLTALVNDVLDLSRIESGKIVYTFESVDVKPQLEKTVALFEPAASRKGVRIELNAPEGLPPVYADRNYFDIVMRNLIDNAIKYVDAESGRVRVSAYASGDGVSIEVADNGIGIPQADLERIFERFYRVDKARSRDLGGTGLGLSIVKHIVLAHRGKVEVRSRINRGSTFTVTIPVAET
ncbi:ATP-binding protein [Chlorobaculum sp. MV4-Y]|uniref:ATP-binding protein n=1 Tax=Chlorobaculum sp. MV4-Y TaxID=2976335 RepID=UPI0021AE71D9|nr:ATP-binding protein [Chlorobaculum sp. MV4-Y]UWX56999.1 ATP-binding protein [Chlorobaculum sp. MV4-Y]